jgi:pilus assembly protein CpaC
LVKDVPRTLEFDYDVGEIAVGNPSIASVVVDRPRRRMVLSPLTPGETALLVFDIRGVQRDTVQLVVTSTDLDVFVRDLGFTFRDIEGLNARRVGNRIVLEGEVYLQRDMDRIDEVLRGNDFVVNLVTLSQDTQRILARRIRDEINISGVEVDTARDRIILKGEVSTDQEKERADKIAGIYVNTDRLVNVISVNPDRRAARASRLVQVSAHFVELNKSFLRYFNFAWTPIATVSAQTAYPRSLNASGRAFDLFAVVTNFLPRLDTAKALGVARVFENPTISVKSGDNASIRAGGNLILPVTSPNSGTASFSAPIELGVTLNVTPTADEREFVDMQVSVDVTSLGTSPRGSAAGDGVLLNTSSVSTTHYVRTGETVALGGVMRSAFTDIKDAPPSAPFTSGFNPSAQLDSTVGSLFQVFKNRAITADRSMFIVFITPEVLISARDASKHLREQMNLQGVRPFEPDEAEEFN